MFWAPGKKKKRWNLNCLKMFRGGWCEAAARTVDVSAGSVCIQKGRWLSLSSPFIDSRLRERTTPFVKYLFIFRNGTDASWKLPAVALWWLSFSPSSFFQWGTQKRNFVSFRFDCNLFWLLFHRFLFDARFSFSSLASVQFLRTNKLSRNL